MLGILEFRWELRFGMLVLKVLLVRLRVRHLRFAHDTVEDERLLRRSLLRGRAMSLLLLHLCLQVRGGRKVCNSTHKLSKIKKSDRLESLDLVLLAQLMLLLNYTTTSHQGASKQAAKKCRVIRCGHCADNVEIHNRWRLPVFRQPSAGTGVSAVL